MSKLQELLAKSKLEKEKANAASTVRKTVENNQAPQGQQKAEALSQEANSAQRGIPASGTGSGQASPAVAPAERQLTALEKLRLKANANNPNTKPVNAAPIVVEMGKEETVLENRIVPVPEPTESKTGATQSADSGTIGAEELRRNLTYLANNIEQKELVKQVVVTIAIQIKQNPALMAHMKNEDMDLVVRGMRRSYSIVARKKTEVREAKQSKNAVVNELEKSFKEAGFGGFSLNLK